MTLEYLKLIVEMHRFFGNFCVKYSCPCKDAYTGTYLDRKHSRPRAGQLPPSGRFQPPRKRNHSNRSQSFQKYSEKRQSSRKLWEKRNPSLLSSGRRTKRLARKLLTRKIANVNSVNKKKIKKSAARILARTIASAS